MHYYKRNLGDYAKKAGRLTMLQHGAYTLLIDSCYDRETFPTVEQAIEWTWASTEAEVEAVKFVLNRFFTLSSDGEYVQDRILQELLEYHAKADKNKQIAIERETKRKLNKTDGSQDVHETSPNHKPITNNHKPITNLEVAKATRPRQAGTPPAPIEQIVEMYNTMLPMLSAVTVVNDSRRRAISSRWREVVTADKLDREKGLEFFQWFFDMVSKSKFLTGKVKDWKADIDFLFNASKFPRIVEGTYHKE